MRICVKDATPQLVGFYSVVKIQIMGSGSASTQSRLIDYLVAVGVRKPTVDSTETRVLLRRLPQKDHKDFVLPGDVVFFCQLEGCSAVSKKFSLREANSFAFTLTENDSGKVVMEFVLMCFDLARALFTRKKRLQRKNFNCAGEVST